MRRQSFGGWKRSVLGPGAKAGGPNYVAQLGSWAPTRLPQQLGDPDVATRQTLKSLLPLLSERTDRTWLRAAVGSDAHAIETEFGRAVDESDLVVESNVFRYRNHPLVWVRSTPGCRVAELLRMVLAGVATGTRVRVSLDPDTSAHLKGLDGRDDETSAGLRVLNPFVDRAETAEQFLERVERDEIGGRIRIVGEDARLVADLAGSGSGSDVAVFAGPVLATGRRELLIMLREQAVSRTLHRFGHVPGMTPGGRPVE